MRVIRLNEIIPGKLYQRGQFMTFPWATKMKMLEQYDIGAVVNLWARPDPELHTRPGLIYIHWPIGGGSPPDNGDIMIHCILELMSIDVKVLVHCEAGVNRSVWLVSKLLAMHDDIRGLDALQHVKSKMNTKIRSGLVKDLEAITK